MRPARVPFEFGIDLDFRTWCRDVEPMRDASYVDRADTADAAEDIIALRRVFHPCPPFCRR